MSDLGKSIDNDLKEALKAKEEVKVSTLRLVKSALERLTKEKKSAGELGEEDVIKVIKQEVKKRLDSIESYKKGNREDLVKQEEAELDILKLYLPPEMADSDIEKIVKEIISENNFKSPDFGQAMKLAMAKIGTQADGQRVAAAVKAALGQGN